MVVAVLFFSGWLLGLPSGAGGKESACNAADMSSIPGLGRSPGGGHGNALQYFYLENPMDRGAWGATRVAKSCTRLKQLHFGLPWWLRP